MRYYIERITSSQILTIQFTRRIEITIWLRWLLGVKFVSFDTQIMLKSQSVSISTALRCLHVVWKVPCHISCSSAISVATEMSV